MGNSLRCCLACVLPCGALDLIRIVHLNGYVEEITRPITAGEVLKANPNHVLSKPSSQGVVRRILILSPQTELKRGRMYFLIPSSSLPAAERKRIAANRNMGGSGSDGDCKKGSSAKKNGNNKCTSEDGHQSVASEYVSKEKKRAQRRNRRTGSSGVWQPHLESIMED